jgi:hypothetical protein
LVGRDWIEATRLAEETAASGHSISGIHTSVCDPVSFKHSTAFVNVGCEPWEMEKEMNVFNFGSKKAHKVINRS